MLDDYKGYDYGFTDQDFLDAIDQAWGFHVTQSISEYIQNRHTELRAEENFKMEVKITHDTNVQIELLNQLQKDMQTLLANSIK